MDELKAILKVILADNFIFAFKTHSYHWNVEGINFSQYHEFFGDLYEDADGVTDMLAEELRALGEYSPISLMDLYNYKTLPEDATKPASLQEMLTNSLIGNNTLIASYKKLFDVASEQGQDGLANLAADRMDKHKKHGWMISSSLKTGA